jgi:membrane-associated protein
MLMIIIRDYLDMTRKFKTALLTTVVVTKRRMRTKQSRYRQLLERYGWAVIFVSPWIPILGDIIPVIAGAKRYDMKKFMIAIAAGKIARAVAMIFLGSYLATIATPPWI